MSQENPQVTINDLASVVVIIDTAAQRGAFKGEEFTLVGTTRDKIANFVKFAQESEAANAAASTQEVTEVKE